MSIAGRTTVKHCRCSSAYQDEKYGKQRRVHNVGKSKTPGYVKVTCTICGDSKQTPEGETMK